MTAGRTRTVWDPALLAYDFGPRHPMSPVRLDLTVRLCEALGLTAPGGPVDVVAPQALADERLHHVHEASYVALVREAGRRPDAPDPRSGLGPPDNPSFAGMHEAAALIAGGSWALAEDVTTGAVEHGINVSGGLHHAMPARASGFCVYNDAALAVAAALQAGARRVAYVDLDVHHGDGVERIFADDPRVLTVSVHESGRTLFPGTGDPSSTGGPGAPGSAVNVALPAGTGDAGWLRAIDGVVPAVLRAEAPDVIVSQHGCDTHLLDPLAHLTVSVDGQRAAARLVHDLAHEVAGGRWLALGGGGYAVVDVVPRTWAHLTGIAAHAEVDPATPVPEVWREHVRRLGRTPPTRMTDGASTAYVPWSDGADPADPVDRAVLATRRAVFPLLGLDPWHD